MRSPRPWVTRRWHRRTRAERVFTVVGATGAFSSTLALVSAGWGAFVSAVLLTSAILVAVWNWERSSRRSANTRFIVSSVFASLCAISFVSFVLFEEQLIAHITGEAGRETLRVEIPDHIRLSQGLDDSDYGYAWAIFEPTFISETDEIVRDMWLWVGPANDVETEDEPIEFEWNAISTFDFDLSTGEESWRFESRPRPIAVAANQSVTHWVNISGPDGWYFEPGEYTITFAARLDREDRIVSESFSIRLDSDSVDYLNQSRGSRYMEFWTFIDSES
jgi:hypothetical protein